MIVDTPASLETFAINCIRGLAIDAVQAANSGHPGMPMGAAPMASVLWTKHLRVNPKNPNWFNRDRFVLSAGHGSALLYALLYAAGFDLGLDEIKRFRQWGSQTPGHPENGLTAGVEMATGPLGQGISTAVGMAIAETFLAEKYNRPEAKVVDHFTYVICSDGDLMEGITQEACSLAGHLKLGKLICLYDSNDITIDGTTDLSFTEDTAAKFRALGWHVLSIDGMDTEAVDRALKEAKSVTDQPSMIIARTIIGWGSPTKQGSEKSHGAALGAEQVEASKSNYGLPTNEQFYFPDEVKKFFDLTERGAGWESEWNVAVAALGAADQSAAEEFTSVISGEWRLPAEWPDLAKKQATRVSCGTVMNALSAVNPTMVTSCADLFDSVKNKISGSPYYSPAERTGRNLECGIREHAMAAAANGMTLHGGMHASTGTFLIFSDYCRPSIRLAALMHIPTTFVFSHDSIGLGEDGPTHQPIEHTMSLRMIPNLNVMRPCDGFETAACWIAGSQSKNTPNVIITSRQDLPSVSPAVFIDHPALKGGYVLREAAGEPQIILVSTGSEVQLAVEAHEQLKAAGVQSRVVSLPSWHLFHKQPEKYRREVLPDGVPVLSIEAGTTIGWGEYADDAIGINHFGASAPAEILFREFGFTVEHVVERAKRLAAQSA